MPGFQIRNNAQTILRGDLMGVDTALMLEHNFLLAEELLLESVKKGALGFSLAAVHSKSKTVLVESVEVKKNDKVVPLIIGRHEMVDIPVVQDSSLSLRHAMLLLACDEENGMVARVLDLRSGTGMVDRLEMPHYSVASNGPVALRMGGTALYIIPWQDWPHDAPKGEASKSLSWLTPTRWCPTLPPEQYMSVVSSKMNDSAILSMFADGAGQGIQQYKKLKGPRVGRIKFSAGDDSSTLEVDEISLRTGVLVGRYPRCDLNPPMEQISMPVSRVHAIFIYVDEQVHIIDTGSTNGLTMGDFDIEALALPQYQPSRFDIVKDVNITWWPG